MIIFSQILPGVRVANCLRGIIFLIYYSLIINFHIKTRLAWIYLSQEMISAYEQERWQHLLSFHSRIISQINIHWKHSTKRTQIYTIDNKILVNIFINSLNEFQSRRSQISISISKQIRLARDNCILTVSRQILIFQWQEMNERFSQHRSDKSYEEFISKVALNAAYRSSMNIIGIDCETFFLQIEEKKKPVIDTHTGVPA